MEESVCIEKSHDAGKESESELDKFSESIAQK